MACIRLINLSPGILTLPAIYGGGTLAPGYGVAILDTLANVQAVFAHVPASYFNLEQLPATPSNAIAPALGTATLVAGTVTVSGVNITANSKIFLGRNTPSGTLGNLSTPSASRVAGQGGTGSFVINSSSGTDTSTIDWEIVD
jgi:hypothetical protein